MFSRHRQLIAAGIFLLDGFWIAASWLAAYWLRFHVLPVPTPLGVPPFARYLWFGAVLLPLALLVLLSLRLYRSGRTSRLLPELGTVLQGIAVVSALAALASYALRGELARSVLLLFAALAALTLCGSRIAARAILRAMRRRGRNLRHVLIVGTGEPALRLARKMGERPEFGLAIAGLVSPVATEEGATIGGHRVAGAVEDLPAIVERTGVELVYLALSRAEYEAESLALERLSDTTVAVRMVPDLTRAFTLNASVEDFDGTPVVLVTETPERGWASLAKRGFDVVLSAALLVLLSPLLLAIALWVRLDSPGPVLYAQERVGFNGRRFRMLKFRTMRTDAEAGGEAGWTKAGDPRRTRAGRILRPLSLDELPQLWNVFVGHMSLVGPRPERPVYVEQFRSSIPRYMLRHHVKAGITGWAQVNGLRGDTPLDRRIEFDLYYIQNWSMRFDLKILFLTAVRVFRDRSAH
jgi:Undecaprenyl-phosphate glucose phosphotransferase